MISTFSKMLALIIVVASNIQIRVGICDARKQIAKMAMGRGFAGNNCLPNPSVRWLKIKVAVSLGVCEIGKPISDSAAYICCSDSVLYQAK